MNPERHAEEPRLSVEEARMEVRRLWGDMGVMGANDHESAAVQEILEQLDTGEITPEDAVARAQKLLDSKMDYH